ncbi:hypothetical protein StoSoilB13_20380 [Arthrobacter sp. StoSoilB13]|nr:hypothetical protein StoSoilB13_20380 [Arthrobacter sp. StoSoilB13]
MAISYLHCNVRVGYFVNENVIGPLNTEHPEDRGQQAYNGCNPQVSPQCPLGGMCRPPRPPTRGIDVELVKRIHNDPYVKRKSTEPEEM